MSLILLIFSLSEACGSLQSRQCGIKHMYRHESHLKMSCDSVEEVEAHKMKA